MAAEVEGDDVIVVPQGLGDAVPLAGVVFAAVDEDERRCGLVTPVPVGDGDALGGDELLDGLVGHRGVLRDRAAVCGMVARPRG